MAFSASDLGIFATRRFRPPRIRPDLRSRIKTRNRDISPTVDDQRVPIVFKASWTFAKRGLFTLTEVK